VHTLAFCAAITATLPWTVRLAFSACVVASFLYNIRHNQNLQALIWHKGNRWQIVADADSSQHISGDYVQAPMAQLHAVDFFSRYLIILQLQQHNKKSRYVIPFDSLDASTFRLLRVRLRIEGFALIGAERYS